MPDLAVRTDVTLGQIPDLQFIIAIALPILGKTAVGRHNYQILCCLFTDACITQTESLAIGTVFDGYMAMANKTKKNQTEVSEIYTTSEESEVVKPILGFTISYPDGKIENVTMEFHREELEQAFALMKLRRARVLKELHSRK